MYDLFVLCLQTCLETILKTWKAYDAIQVQALLPKKVEMFQVKQLDIVVVQNHLKLF